MEIRGDEMGYMDPARRKWMLRQNNESLVLFGCDKTSDMNNLKVGKTYFNRSELSDSGWLKPLLNSPVVKQK